MNKTIRIDLFNPESFNAAVRELEEYSKRIKAKSAELQECVATYIANNARITFNNSIAGDLVNESALIGNVAVYVENDGNVTLVIASGKDAVFMEFGAGVLYNGPVGSSPNPWGVDLGYTIGSYGDGNGAKEVWGYSDGDGTFHLTRGTPASMPLYRAVTDARRDLVQMAREVFGE